MIRLSIILLYYNLIENNESSVIALLMDIIKRIDFIIIIFYHCLYDTGIWQYDSWKKFLMFYLF